MYLARNEHAQGGACSYSNHPVTPRRGVAALSPRPLSPQVVNYFSLIASPQTTLPNGCTPQAVQMPARSPLNITAAPTTPVRLDLGDEDASSEDSTPMQLPRVQCGPPILLEDDDSASGSLSPASTQRGGVGVRQQRELQASQYQGALVVTPVEGGGGGVRAPSEVSRGVVAQVPQRACGGVRSEVVPRQVHSGWGGGGSWVWLLGWDGVFTFLSFAGPRQRPAPPNPTASRQEGGMSPACFCYCTKPIKGGQTSHPLFLPQKMLAFLIFPSAGRFACTISRTPPGEGTMGT